MSHHSILCIYIYTYIYIYNVLYITYIYIYIEREREREIERERERDTRIMVRQALHGGGVAQGARRDARVADAVKQACRRRQGNI